MARYVAAHLSVMDVRGLRTGVVGLGPAGLIAVQLLRAMGAAEVAAADLLEDRRQLALRLGATSAINPAEPRDIQALADEPWQASVDCTGASSGLQVALDHTRGPVMMYGVVHGEAKISTRHWFAGTYSPQRRGPGPQDTAWVQTLWRNGQLDTQSLISVRLPYAEYAAGIEMLLAKKAIRVLYYPG
jgi:threonine dehydrogenase-like Zn-dependent dehydrogenase